jgi:HEAT repeat protein
MAAQVRRQRTPRQSVEALADEIGTEVVIRRCIELLEGRDVDGSVIFALGGPPARWAIDGGASGPDYWLRVWALRGLLWVWADEATSAVLSVMTDGSWRVREMAAKVTARHTIDEALPQLVELREDVVPRVRVAAQWAITRLTESGP